MKVLVADDHALFRSGLHYVLAPLDKRMTILEAADHAEAAALLRQHPDMDLALIDLYMPGRGDATTAFDLLASDNLTVPIVVLSGSEDRRELRRVLDAGAMGFIPKTSPPEVMLNALRLVLAGGVYVPPMLLQSGPAESSILTARQREILVRLIEGRPNKVIGNELGISLSTVKAHVATIFRILNVADRTQAAAAAERLGLSIEPAQKP
jgi:two-component system, NarL family, nitrate/nitrite response regulator NarL